MREDVEGDEEPGCGENGEALRIEFFQLRGEGRRKWETYEEENKFLDHLRQSEENDVVLEQTDRHPRQQHAARQTKRIQRKLAHLLIRLMQPNNPQNEVRCEDNDVNSVEEVERDAKVRREAVLENREPLVEGETDAPEDVEELPGVERGRGVGCGRGTASVEMRERGVEGRTALDDEEEAEHDGEGGVFEPRTNVRDAKAVVIEEGTTTPVVDLDDGLVLVGILNEGAAKTRR